jgi:ABC-2 type transport system ATP-binding protein
VLRLSHVSRRYGTRVAVDDLSLEVRRGEVLGLLGPNGAGKTTTVGLAVGLLEPDAGEVSVAGAGSPRSPEVRRRIGVAPQALSLYETLSCEENLLFLGRVQGLRAAALRDRVEWSLSFAALADRRRDPVSRLSGGMQRRLNLAAALVHDPELVILDEPTVGVDPQSRNAILERILELRAAGRTVIYTTHYMEEAARLCDRVAIVDQGRLLALGTLEELLRDHGATPVLVLRAGGTERRLPAPDPLAELVRQAATGPVDDFRVERPDLEQVFLALTGRRLRDG